MKPFLEWLAGEIEADPKAMRRGVSHCTINPATWEKYGAPTGVRLSTGVTIPITPTGRGPDGRITWYHKRRKRRR